MFKFGKSQDSSRIPEMVGIPETGDLQFILSKAQRNWRTSIELPFRTGGGGATFTIVVKCEMGTGVPCWTLARTDISGSPVRWSHKTNDVLLVQNLISLEYTAANEKLKQQAGHNNVAPSTSVGTNSTSTPSEPVSTGTPLNPLLARLQESGKYGTMPVAHEQPDTSIVPCSTEMPTAVAPYVVQPEPAVNERPPLETEWPDTTLNPAPLKKEPSDSRISRSSGHGTKWITTSEQERTWLHDENQRSQGEASHGWPAAENNAVSTASPPSGQSSSIAPPSSAASATSSSPAMDNNAGSFFMKDDAAIAPPSFAATDNSVPSSSPAIEADAVSSFMKDDAAISWPPSAAKDNDASSASTKDNVASSPSRYASDTGTSANDAESNSTIPFSSSGESDSGVNQYTKPTEASRIKLSRELKLTSTSVESSLSRRDTGIFTYAAFTYFFDNECIRFNRGGLPFSILLFELRRETAIGTTETISSEAMREAGARLRTMKRQLDVLAHFEDEGYVFILPHSGSAGALTFAQRVKKLLLQQPLLQGLDPATLKFFFGIAAMPEHGTKPEDVLIAARQEKQKQQN